MSVFSDHDVITNVNSKSIIQLGGRIYTRRRVYTAADFWQIQKFWTGVSNLVS